MIYNSFSGSFWHNYDDEDDDDDVDITDEELLELLGFLGQDLEIIEEDYDILEDEHEDTRFWRLMAEEYEWENTQHLRFQNLLLIHLWKNGGLHSLGLNGYLN